MQEFLDDIEPAVKACGLRFPRREDISIAAPATLDGSLLDWTYPVPTRGTGKPDGFALGSGASPP